MFLFLNCLFLSNEMQFFIQQHKLPIKSSAKVHAKGGVRNSMAKADKYFSELSPEQVSCDKDLSSSCLYSAVQVNKLYEIYKYDFQMFGYEHESFVELAKLELHKKKAPPKDSFDLALEQVKKEGKYAQVKLKNKKKGHGKGGRGMKNINKKNSKIKNK